MKRYVFVPLILLSIFFRIDLTGAQQQSTPKILRIAVVVDGPWERNREFFDLLQKEVPEVVGSRAQILITGDKLLEGDWTPAGVRRLNDRLLADPEVDLILGMGVIASQDLCTRGPLPKPVIAPVVLDPARQNIPFKTGSSGVHNLNYLIFPTTFERDIKLFQEIVPFKKLVYIASQRYMQALPPAQTMIEEVGKSMNLEITPIFVGAAAEEVLKAIPPDAEAVYFEPVLHLAAAEFDKLVREFIARRLPSFSLLGESEVRHGLMATANPDFFPRLVRRIALNIQRILQGEDPGTLTVNFPAGKKLFINLRTATAVGVSPKWSTLFEAELIQVDTTAIPEAQQFTLASAIRRIAEANLDVQAKIREVSADAENVTTARANLLPKLNFSTTGFQIDQDRAQAGFQPERSASAEVALTQVLFSEPAWANVRIQSALHDSRRSDLELVRLDAITEGARLYLNYLRARKIFYLLLDNLRVTRSNLELAQIRESAGTAGPEEPLRWEVEIAEVRKAAMELQTQMHQASLGLKQVLNIPLAYVVNISEVSLDDPALLLSNKPLLSYLEDPVSFELISDFMVKEGLAHSHELRQLEAAMRAQERVLRSTRYSYFAPAVSAFVTYGNNFYKSSQPALLQLNSLPAPPEGLDFRVPLYLGQLFSAVSPGVPNRNDWNVGIQLSLNLFNGFATRASEEKAHQELEQYRLQRQATAERVALRIRYEMHNAKATYFAIQQSRLEQEAAHKTLDIVKEAYSRGAVSILNLLDAQNAALRADQVTANAFYDFFIAYMQLQRATGRFDVLMSAGEREEFLQSLNQFMTRALQR